MLFTIGEVDLLKLLRWCQTVSLSTIAPYYTKAELSNLACCGYLKTNTQHRTVALTERGHRLLEALPDRCAPRSAKSSRDTLLARRISLGTLMSTCYLGGTEVFTTEIAQLQTPPAYYMTALSRSKGTGKMNPWGNSRMAGIAALGDTLYAAYFVNPGITAFALDDEVRIFSNNTASLPMRQKAFLFVGSSYAAVLEEVEQIMLPFGDRTVSYGEAYQRLSQPVHLLSCDDTGGKQLALMSVPNYREQFTRAALDEKYTPPPADVPNCDATFLGLPFVMAADMDLRRVDALCETASRAGYGQITLAALEEQCEAIFYARYRNTGKARVFVLTPPTIQKVLGHPLVLSTPPRTPYLTPEGGVFHVPIISASRQAGRPT